MARDFRQELAHTMRLRHTPELRFRYDDSLDRGERIDALLRGGGEQGVGSRENES